ncbi:MAG: hypothetical protein M3280_00170, partial [Actinomycetota bacterium]|nr:hypothetical protein [Actinomycetota bacterium]
MADDGERTPVKEGREFARPIGRLRVEAEAIEECRQLASEIARPIVDLARSQTTVSIERACLRLVGVDGIQGEGADAVPTPNVVIDRIRAAMGLE